LQTLRHNYGDRRIERVKQKTGLQLHEIMSNIFKKKNVGATIA